MLGRIQAPCGRFVPARLHAFDQLQQYNEFVASTLRPYTRSFAALGEENVYPDRTFSSSGETEQWDGIQTLLLGKRIPKYRLYL